jgi:DNA-binding MarR family transcriptional regulator
MMPNDELPLALRTAYLTLHRRSDAVFVEYGITADQFVLLATLARGQAMTQRELAARMPSDPSTVRAMLVLLEKQGLVTREAHPTDARARMVSLTKSGVRTYQLAFDAGQELRDQMTESLSAAETRTLLSLLQRMTASLKDSVPETAAVSEHTE